MVTRETQLRNNLALPLERRVVAQCGIRCADGRIRTNWGTLSSFLIGGMPQQGKSVILAFMAGQAVLAGASLMVFDPHCQIKSRGLMTKIEPLSPWFLAAPRDFGNISKVVDHFAWLGHECQRRQQPGGLDGAQPIFTIVDEFNGLFTRLDKEQAGIVSNALGEIARAGPKMGLFLIIAAHQWALGKTGGGDIRKNIPCRVSVKSEIGELAMTMDMQKEMLRPYTVPSMRPGEAIIYTPLLDVRRCLFPNTTARDIELIAQVRRRISEYSGKKSDKLSLLPASEEKQREIEPAARLRDDNLFRKDIQNQPEYSDRAAQALSHDLNVSPEEWQAIVDCGNKQLRETGKVVRTKIRDDLRWNNYQYEYKIKPVCAALGWNRSMNSMTDVQWESLKAKHDFRCIDCGKREPEIALERDHVIPRVKGGSDAVENRAPRCKRCNQIKGIKTARRAV